MKRRLSINSKLLLYIITTAAIIYSFSIGYISFNSKQSALNDAYRFTDKVAQQNATEIEGDFNADLAVVRTLSYAFKTYKSMTNEEWKSFSVKCISIFLKKILIIMRCGIPGNLITSTVRGMNLPDDTLKQFGGKMDKLKKLQWLKV